MAKKKVKNSIHALRKAAKEHAGARYVLRLFVVGLTPKSQRAIQAVRDVCETHLKDRYELEIVDIYQQPELLKQEQIVVAPTLIKKLPLPLRRIIGDMVDSDKVLLGLDLTAKE
jgi:circadian clock protein KaiB